MIKKRLLVFFLSLMALHAGAQNFEVIHLYYETDSFKLTHAQRYALDSVVEYYSNRMIMIDGHADYMGSEDRNKQIAGYRANAVLRYLVDRGFPETQVMSARGSGNTTENVSKDLQVQRQNRRVDIFITKGISIKSKLKHVTQLDTQVVKKTTPITISKSEPVVIDPKKVTDIDYKKIKVGDLVALRRITFAPGSDTILPQSYDELENLYQTLKNNPTLKIKLEGHVCCSVYPDGYLMDTPNWDLSVNRALRVQSLLIERGIDPERLSYTGFGRTHPIFDQEQTAEEAQINRRVEIRIIEK